MITSNAFRLIASMLLTTYLSNIKSKHEQQESKLGKKLILVYGNGKTLYNTVLKLTDNIGINVSIYADNSKSYDKKSKFVQMYNKALWNKLSDKEQNEYNVIFL